MTPVAAKARAKRHMLVLDAVLEHHDITAGACRCGADPCHTALLLTVWQEDAERVGELEANVDIAREWSAAWKTVAKKHRTRATQAEQRAAALETELADLKPKYEALLTEIDAHDQASSWANTSSTISTSLAASGGAAPAEQATHKYMPCAPGGCVVPVPFISESHGMCHWPYGNGPYTGGPFCELSEGDHERQQPPAATSRCGSESNTVLDRGSLSMGYDHRGATTPHIVPTMQGEIAMSEDCCWTWIRDHCPLKRSGTCDCECHTTYPEPPDWKARAEKAEAELAAAVALVEQLRAENQRLRCDLVSAGVVLSDAIRLAHHHGHDGGTSQGCERDTCVIGWRLARELLAAGQTAAPVDGGKEHE